MRRYSLPFTVVEPVHKAVENHRYNLWKAGLSHASVTRPPGLLASQACNVTGNGVGAKTVLR